MCLTALNFGCAQKHLSYVDTLGNKVTLSGSRAISLDDFSEEKLKRMPKKVFKQFSKEEQEKAKRRLKKGEKKEGKFQEFANPKDTKLGGGAHSDDPFMGGSSKRGGKSVAKNMRNLQGANSNYTSATDLLDFPKGQTPKGYTPKTSDVNEDEEEWSDFKQSMKSNTNTNITDKKAVAREDVLKELNELSKRSKNLKENYGQSNSENPFSMQEASFYPSSQSQAIGQKYQTLGKQLKRFHAKSIYTKDLKERAFRGWLMHTDLDSYFADKKNQNHYSGFAKVLLKAEQKKLRGIRCQYKGNIHDGDIALNKVLQEGNSNALKRAYKYYKKAFKWYGGSRHDDEKGQLALIAKATICAERLYNKGSTKQARRLANKAMNSLGERINIYNQIEPSYKTKGMIADHEKEKLLAKELKELNDKLTKRGYEAKGKGENLIHFY